MYRSSWFLAAAVVGANMALVQQAVVAKSASEIEAIARSVTVKIQVYQGKKNPLDKGSGVIIDRQGDLYTLVTNRHVICITEDCNWISKNDEYVLSLADNKELTKPKKMDIKFVGKDLDLAIIRFRSNRNLKVAQLSAAGSLKVKDKVYTAGFPEFQGFAFGEGEVIAAANKRLIGDNGYSIIYDAYSEKGMSGGAVFNSDGQLVAVHGQGDRFTSGTEIDDNSIATETKISRVGQKIGYNRGIPVHWLKQWIVQNFKALRINLASARSTPDIRATRADAPSTADEHFITGFNKFVKPSGDVQASKRAAIQEFSIAIQKNPQYQEAYFIRAFTYEQLQEFQYSLQDYNQAIAINPKIAEAYSNRALLKTNKLNDAPGALKDYNQAIAINPKYDKAYSNRALLKTNKLNDTPGALKDYNQAIAINSKLAEAYSNRALLKTNKLNDTPGALKDYNQAIAINPKIAGVYFNRALLKEDKLNDAPSALKDYDQAIAINPKYDKAYSNRALLKEDKLNDAPGALKDYDQAIAINPKLTEAYFNRALLKKNKLNDAPGALRDYNQAIAINPKDAEAYFNRALLKKNKLNDAPSAAKDFQQAARLSRDQGNTQILKIAIEELRKLGATE
jgi:tetratricopeptide (TPR) repeat protein